MEMSGDAELDDKANAGQGVAAVKRPTKGNARKKDRDSTKRRCVSTACLACRHRKSKCDGIMPSCAACSSVYGTECVYDPNSDHRRKGVYKKDIDNLKTRNSTLQTLIEAILNYPEDEVIALVRQIRTCDSLDDVAEDIIAKENGLEEVDEEDESISPLEAYNKGLIAPTFETKLSGKMGELRLDDGSVRFIGGTSNLIFLGEEPDGGDGLRMLTPKLEQYNPSQQDNPITSWTTVTTDANLILKLVDFYFCWHYTYFATLSKNLFLRDFYLGNQPEHARRQHNHCTSLLVNAILALACHFTSIPGTRADPADSTTAGDHFFKEAKRLIMENDEHEKPQITTVQALALMSVREAGCGREAKGWVYSGMSFRMAFDLGLNLDSGGLRGSRDTDLDDEEIDARRMTMWGCFLFDKCWSNYLGRQPQLLLGSITCPKFDVFPVEDSSIWTATMDDGSNQAHAQPCRTRAVALQISALCEISSDLLTFFYHPTHIDRAVSKQAELKKLSDLHTRLEAWKKNLPNEFEAREGALPNVLLMHMFFQLLFIHLFRPFLKYTSSTSPLPPHVSPRKLCTQAACLVSKLLRLYKRTHGLRHICNIAVYIAHSACTIHLLNLPDKTAKRDIIHGVKHLEEIAEGWLCARRTLGILNILVRRWKIDLPEQAAAVLARAESKFGAYTDYDMSRSARGTSMSTETATITTSPPLSTIVRPAATQPGYFSNVNYVMPGTLGLASRALPPNSAQELQHTNFYSPQLQATQPQGRKRHADSTASTESSIDQTSIGAENKHSPTDLAGFDTSLVEESRDWWLKDQNQLAAGFDNWSGIQMDLNSNGNTMNGHGTNYGVDYDVNAWYDTL